MEKCFGSFDGASTMAGTLSGVQATCKENNSKILYVHCYAHCLNLALVAACSSQRGNKLIFDFFGVVQFTYSFIEGSCVRHAVFETIAKEMNNSVKHLKSLSTARWACRAEAVSAIKENYKAIVLAIEDILQNTTHAVIRAKGRGSLFQLKSFEFIACLHIVNPILQIILKVNKDL